MVRFKIIPNLNLPVLPNDIIVDFSLSTDKHYLYCISITLYLGTVDEDFSLLEIGSLYHFFVG